MAFPFAAAFSSAFARTLLAPPFPATSAAFFPATLVGFINGGPGAKLCFFLADTALFVTALDVTRFSFLLSRVLLLASSCHNSFLFVQKVNASPRPNGFILQIDRLANLPLNDKISV